MAKVHIKEGYKMLAECAAPDTALDPPVQSVEISGWDAKGQFFVEIACLDVTASGEATAFLCHPVTDGSLVFVRPVSEPTQSHQQKGHPAPNEAHPMDSI